jgi:hypothetical protein
MEEHQALNLHLSQFGVAAGIIQHNYLQQQQQQHHHLEQVFKS